MLLYLVRVKYIYSKTWRERWSDWLLQVKMEGSFPKPVLQKHGNPPSLSASVASRSLWKRKREQHRIEHHCSPALSAARHCGSLAYRVVAEEAAALPGAAVSVEVRMLNPGEGGATAPIAQ